ncbi:MAG TPA: ABC transporter substrate-binding protein [Actinomycetota bacterium]|jgi:branched-chain amino acid transport system substrate-binding protein|nr:ABC transporter substrate-binding protein [Actinomycetota bacterium]
MRASSRVLCLALVVLAAACTGSESPSEETTSVGEVRIGVLAPLTEGDKAVGTESLRGAQLAATLLNGEEGEVSLAGIGPDGLARLGSPKVTIVQGDTRGEPARGASEAARLVTAERAVGLVGAYNANVTNQAAQRSERLGVPFVNGDASAEFLTESGLDWFFRTGPTDRTLGESFFSALAVAGGPSVRSVGVLNAADQAGTVAGELVEDLGEQGGFQVTRVSFPPTQQDLTAQVSQVRGARPDAVFVVTSNADQTRRALGAFQQLGYTPPGLLMFGAGFLETPTLQAAGAASRGLLTSAGWSREVAARNPAAKPVIELYEETYGSPMTEVAAGTFTAVLTLAKAMDDAGSIEPERVRTALLGLDIPGRDTIMPWNGVRFDATHQNSGATGVVEQIDANDALRVVFPDELAQEPVKWPLATARGQQSQ